MLAEENQVWDIQKGFGYFTLEQQYGKSRAYGKLILFVMIWDSAAALSIDP